MLRYAFSPTHDMHIGDLRVALLNYIVSKQRDEAFIVRVDDGDKESVLEKKDQEFLDLLGLFSLEYTQIIHQSQNFKFHSAMALQLIHEKKAFSCFCSDEWLEKKRQEAKDANKEYCYDDACRNLPAELVIDNTAPFRVRIVRPNEDIVLHDKIKGTINFTPDQIDSFTILHQDKTPTQEFSSSIDDMLNDISLIIREEKLLSSTAKEIHIRKELAYNKAIEYAHLPTVQDENSITVKKLLEDGYLPEAIANYTLSLILNAPKAIFTIKEAQEWFNFDMILKEPKGFNIKDLQDLNKEHMRAMDATELSRYVGFADAEIGELAKIYLDEVATTRELKVKIAPIFESRLIPVELQEEALLLKKSILDADYHEEYSSFKSYLLQESGLSEEKVERVLRLLLTNAQDGPELAKIYKYLKNYIGEIIK